MLYDYWSPSIVGQAAISQRGLLAFSLGDKCQVWRDWYNEKQKAPYLKHDAMSNQPITALKFVPYEDFLGVALDGGKIIRLIVKQA